MRDDLQFKHVMIANGFIVKVDDRDKGRDVPHHSLGFVRGDLYVWQAGHSHSKGVDIYWQTARLIDGRFHGHRQFDTLQDVINAFPPEE